MEGYHKLSLDNLSKIFAEWFKKCSGGYIIFTLPLIPEIHRVANSSNILCPGSKEQVHFLVHCKLSKTTLDFIKELINLNYTFNSLLKFSTKPKPS